MSETVLRGGHERCSLPGVRRLEIPLTEVQVADAPRAAPAIEYASGIAWRRTPNAPRPHLPTNFKGL
jgi:hypothetical protein